MRSTPRLRWVGFVLLVGIVGALSGCEVGDTPVAVLATAAITGPAPFDASFDLSYTAHPLDLAMAYELDFGDTSPRTTGNDFDVAVHHTYAAAGRYLVVLTVTDERGAESRDSVEIMVDNTGPPIGLLVGMTAPDFTAHVAGGGEFTLSSTRGSVVLLDFWGAWCPPCRATLPHLDALARAYGGRGLVAVVVSTDLKEEDAIATLADGDFTRFTSLWEPGGKGGNSIAQLYGVASSDVGIPRTYVLDRQGVLRFVGHPTDLTRAMIETLL